MLRHKILIIQIFDKEFLLRFFHVILILLVEHGIRIEFDKALKNFCCWSHNNWGGYFEEIVSIWPKNG